MDDVSSSDCGSQFVSFWQIFSGIGNAEQVTDYEAAGYLVSCLEKDLTFINCFRARDESCRVLPLDISARLGLMEKLHIFARHGTLFDGDDRPTDRAQQVFEGTGFFTADIFQLLSRFDVAFAYPDSENSEWMPAYQSRAWISRRRTVKLLLAAAKQSELSVLEYEEAFCQWDEAVGDAINRGAISAMDTDSNMLSHVAISLWCMRNNYSWPFDVVRNCHDDNLSLPSVGEQPEVNLNVLNEDIGLTKREKQIRAIEKIAETLAFARNQIPDGGKAKIRCICLSEYSELFGAGEHPFNDAWKAASKANRIAMANRDKFAGR
jgi:hypothetical protein